MFEGRALFPGLGEYTWGDVPVDVDGRRLPIVVGIAEDGVAGRVLPPISTTRWTAGAGVELRLKRWEGWSDTPGVRANPEDVPGGDGTYDDTPLFTGRTIILEGTAHTTGPDAADQLVAAQQAFVELLAGEDRSGTVTVWLGRDEPRFCRVRLGGPSKFDVTAPSRAEWSLSLYARDPRRVSALTRSASTLPWVPGPGISFPWVWPTTFGEGNGTGGRVQCSHDGSIPADVRLSIQGACTNPQIVNEATGERLAFQTDVAHSLVVETGDWSVIRDGTAAWGWTRTADSVFWQLPARSESTVLFTCESGTPTLTISYGDTSP